MLDWSSIFESKKEYDEEKWKEIETAIAKVKEISYAINANLDGAYTNALFRNKNGVLLDLDSTLKVLDDIKLIVKQIIDRVKVI